MKKDRQENLEFDFGSTLEKLDGDVGITRDGAGGLSDEDWRCVKAALEFSREDDRKRKLLIEMKPLSHRIH